MKYFIFVILLIIPSLYCLILDDGYLTRLQVSQDFGQNTFRMPKVVAFPTSVNEVVEAITYARKNNLTVIARGEGHNTYGYSLHDGMVIDQSLMKDIQILGYEAKVQCGVTMLELNHKLKTTNKIYANNPAYVGMTACGLISTQGIGAYATLEGSVSEYPTEITIVTASGKILTCNNNVNRDYFNVVRGGLGQHAVIVSATFPLKPRPLHMLVGYVQYHYQDFDSLIKGNILALERGYQNKATLTLNDPLVVSSGFFAEGVANGFVPDLSTPWILILEVNRFVNDQSSDTLDLTGFVGAIQTFSFQRTSYEDTYQPHYDSIQSGKELGNGLYYNPHLFTYYLVPYEQQKVVATLQLMSSFLNGLQVVDHMEILAMDRTKFRNPLNSIKFNNQKMFYITLINNANIPTPLSLVSTYTQANALVYNASLIYDALVKIWGYGVISTVPYGYFPYSAEEHYGFEKFQQILRIKKRIDPQNIFSGGRNLFKHYFKDEAPSHSQNDHDDHQNDHDDHQNDHDDHQNDHDDHYSHQNDNNSQHHSDEKK